MLNNLFGNIINIINLWFVSVLHMNYILITHVIYVITHTK